MNDLLVNLALSGGIAGSYLAVERLRNRGARLLALRPAREQVLPDKRIAELAAALRPALEDFIQTETYEVTGEHGPEFDAEALVQGEVLRRAGVLVKERHIVEETKPEDYRFMLNFTSACQDGLEVAQPYVRLLVKGLAHAITDMGHPVAINAIGKDFVVVKRFQDPLDVHAVEHVSVDPVLNLYQGIDAATLLAEQDATLPTISFYIINGSCPVGDARHKIKAEFSAASRIYAYQIGKEGPDADLLHLTQYTPQWTAQVPVRYANAFYVEGSASLQTTFTEFLRQAKQYR